MRRFFFVQRSPFTIRPVKIKVKSQTRPNNLYTSKNKRGAWRMWRAITIHSIGRLWLCDQWNINGFGILIPWLVVFVRSCGGLGWRDESWGMWRILDNIVQYGLREGWIAVQLWKVIWTRTQGRLWCLSSFRLLTCHFEWIWEIIIETALLSMYLCICGVKARRQD